MKTKTLGHQIVEAAKINRELLLPEGQRTYRTWPLCLTCGREVDAAELMDVSSKGCEIRAKCHGAEDSVRVTWNAGYSDNSKSPLADRNIDWQLKRALHDSNFFDPTHWLDTSKRK